jgi:hypothetical protein
VVLLNQIRIGTAHVKELPQGEVLHRLDRSGSYLLGSYCTLPLGRAVIILSSPP